MTAPTPDDFEAEPEMYPLTDYPDYREDFDDFKSLAADVQRAPEDLNHVVSWYIYDEWDKDWDPEDDAVPSFAVLTFMPRKSQTSEKRTENFTRAEVEAWLLDYVRPRTMRWYGWSQ